MTITPFKVIQGHQFWYQSKPHIIIIHQYMVDMQKIIMIQQTKNLNNLIYGFLLVIITNLPPVLHRFQVMADYWLNFR